MLRSLRNPCIVVTARPGSLNSIVAPLAVSDCRAASDQGCPWSLQVRPRLRQQDRPRQGLHKRRPMRRRLLGALPSRWQRTTASAHRRNPSSPPHTLSPSSSSSTNTLLVLCACCLAHMAKRTCPAIIATAILKNSPSSLIYSNRTSNRTTVRQYQSKTGCSIFD